MKMLNTVFVGGFDSVSGDQQFVAPVTLLADGDKAFLVAATDPFAALDLKCEMLANDEIHFPSCLGPPEHERQTNSLVA